MRKLREYVRLLLSAFVLCLAPDALVAQEADPVSTDSAEVATDVADHGAKHAPGTPDYNLPPLQFEVELFLFTLLFFGLFVLGMRRTVWLPLVDSLDSREVRIAQAEADARAARQEVEKLSADAERRLADVHDQVGKLLTEARTSAEARKLEIVAQAEQDARRLKEEALAEIAQAREQALRELEQTMDQQVAVATQHVAGRSL